MNFSNQKGFTFVQIFVSLFLIGGLIVVGFKIFQDQSKLGKSSSFKFESLYLLDEIKSVLNDSKSCSYSFKGLSAVSQPVSHIKRFDPITQKEEIIFGLFAENKMVYGQDNVLIHSMDIDGEGEDFNFEKGYAVLKITFHKFRDNKSIFSGMIPFRVQVDGSGKIITCHSSSGIRRESSYSSKSSPWKHVKDEDGQVEKVDYLGKKLMVGTVEGKAKLNVEGGISLFSNKLDEQDLETCLPSQKNLLFFNAKKDGIYFCNGGDSPIKLHDNLKYVQTLDNITLESSSAVLERKITDKRYHLCRLIEMSSQGECMANPLDEIRGKFRWELINKFDEGPELKCKFLCSN